MGNCETNCSNCMGKDGEHAEFNMDSQVQRFERNEDGARGLGIGAKQDYNQLLTKKMKYIVKVQAWWRGHTARRLIGLLKSKQLGSSKYFTQEEARETITKNIYNPH